MMVIGLIFPSACQSDGFIAPAMKIGSLPNDKLKLWRIDFSISAAMKLVVFSEICQILARK
jgi:hypothetical protein